VSAAGSTQAKAAHAKGARTRATHQAESALRQTQTATRETAGVVGDYAERAVLIPVGAALIARDRVVETVSDTVATYSSTSKAQAQLRRFERRGVTARNRLEREVRKARVRVERELRQRRRTVESTVSDIDARREAIAKNGSELANKVPELANRVPELANKVQERILSLV
jgi:prefoldin subunit 5